MGAFDFFTASATGTDLVADDMDELRPRPSTGKEQP